MKFVECPQRQEESTVFKIDDGHAMFLRFTNVVACYTTYDTNPIVHQGDGAPAQAAFNLAGGDDLLEVWHP